MSKIFSTAIPEPESLLELAPEELGGIVLQYFNSLPNVESKEMLNPDVFCAEIGVQGYPLDKREAISMALMEAWVWLEREGLVARQPGNFMGRQYFITRRGKTLKAKDDFESFRFANLLPQRILNPVIVQKVRPAFLRGDYDTAVFQAFKEVEVSVRTAGNYPDTLIGVNLMRKAFHKDEGKLTDSSLPEAERQAMSHLFAGAIGLYKNPQSHRYVMMTEPIDTVELIVLASHLTNIVEKLKR
jgi:uncharacterized protein (TIGR02391 family)